MTKEQKAEIMKKFGKTANDSGSPEVQVALLTARINGLKGHFEAHSKDYASNRGLLQMIGKRRSLLRYVQTQDENRYAKLIKELELRK